MSKIEFKFEHIDNSHSRARVQGGWLVKALEPVTHRCDHGNMEQGWAHRVAMAFVPDPFHDWEIELPKE